MLSGQSRASICSGLMDEMAPLLRDMLGALEKLAAQPDRRREFIEELAAMSRSKIAEAVDEVNAMELPLPHVDRRKAHHKRGASDGRRARG